VKKEKVLVLGAGRSDIQRIAVQPQECNGPFSANFERVITVDSDASAEPTLVLDLTSFLWGFDIRRTHGMFPEVHAYEVLHLLGDPLRAPSEVFFTLWRNIWEVVEPGGLVCATTPWWESKWVFQDPSAIGSQVYTPEKLWYLDQAGVNLPYMTNYSQLWPKPYSFTTRHAQMRGEDPKNSGFTFVLQKPEESNDRENSEGSDQLS
jgi:hypothetical protein